MNARATNPTAMLNQRVTTRMSMVAALANVSPIARRYVINAIDVISYVPTPPGDIVTAPIIDAVEWTNVALRSRFKDAKVRDGSPAPDRILSKSHSSIHSINHPGTLIVVLTSIGFGLNV